MRRRTRYGRGRVRSHNGRKLIWTGFAAAEGPAGLAAAHQGFFSETILEHAGWASTQAMEKATIRRIILHMQAMQYAITAGGIDGPPRLHWAIRLGDKDEPPPTVFPDDPVYYDENDILQFGMLALHQGNFDSGNISAFNPSGSVAPFDIRVMRKINSGHTLYLDLFPTGAGLGFQVNIAYIGRILIST